MFNRLKYLLIGLLIAMPTFAVAAPVIQNFTNIAPFITDTYDNGTSTQEWFHTYTKILCLSGDCRSAWPNGTFGTTSIFATAPLNWNTTTATLSITQAGNGANGYLSSTDWNLFNNKISSSSLSAISPIFYSSATGVISSQAATTGQNGYLTAIDFGTFNNKISSTSLSITTIGTSGAATYTPSTGIFNIPQYQAAGSYLTSYDAFTHPAYGGSATSSLLTLTGGLLVNFASSTFVGNATTTGTFFATTASSTNLFGAGLFACSGTSALTWTGGTFGCAAQPQGTVTQVNTTYPVTGGSFTTSGTIALAFGTTTSNTWANTQTFTNSPVFSTLGAGTVNALANGTIYNTSTSTPSVTAPITYSGTLGQFIGGSSGSFGCATCLTANQTITLTGAVTGSGSTAITTAFGAIAQGVLANAGAASAVPVSTATSSLGIALSDTTGTLAVTRGGTGVATLASGGVLFGNGASAVQVTTSGAASTLLAGNAGAPTFTGAPTVSGTMTAATFTASAANSGGGFIFHSSIASSSPSFIFQDSLNAIWGQIFSDGTTGSFKIYTGNGSNTLGLTQNYLGNVAIGVDLAGLYSASGLPDTTKLVITRTPSTTIGANYYLGVGGAGGDQGVNTYRTIGFGFNSGGGNFYPAYMGYQETSNGGNTMGDLVFGTRANTTGTNVGNERMRITSAGNVGIATTTPVSRLTVNGDIGTDGAISAVSSCGSGAAMTTGSTDTAGEVTEGTLATGCTITFAAAKARAPFCTASSEAGLAFSFSQSASALTIVNIGALSSTKVDYICVQNNL